MPAAMWRRSSALLGPESLAVDGESFGGQVRLPVNILIGGGVVGGFEHGAGGGFEAGEGGAGVGEGFAVDEGLA